MATCHAYGIETTSVLEFFPYGIYTIPEISSGGKTEEELTGEGVPYEVVPTRSARRPTGKSPGARSSAIQAAC
ncbi:MAG: hypothetical protein VCB77_04690 [Alphaproteobacteria bacterium]